jgi:malonyl-CoA O-methyltransferase
MSEDIVLDKRVVRRSFDRAAKTYDAAAVLQHEVCRRSLERLDFIRHAPSRILDAGCGTGNAWKGLNARYPAARIIGLDLAPGMLRQAGSTVAWHQRLMRRGPLAVCGDLERLPLAKASIDLAWSNLALQWVNALPRAFAEMHRVLAPGGELRIVTDHDELWAWDVEHVGRATDIFERRDFARPASAGEGELVGTNFERKFRREGRPFHAMTLVKR